VAVAVTHPSGVRAIYSLHIVNEHLRRDRLEDMRLQTEQTHGRDEKMRLNQAPFPQLDDD
jgi:hypothetical protein